LFTTRDYVRGHGMGLTDWDPADGEGFHLVLRRAYGADGEVPKTEINSTP
jgi:hypothetical protein